MGDADLEAAQARVLPAPLAAAGRRRVSVALAAGAVLTIGAWWFVLGQESTGVPALGEVVSRTTDFVRRLLGLDITAPPAYAQASRWVVVGRLAFDTVVMSVLAAGMAGLGALATIAFAARSLTIGEFGPASPLAGRVVYLVARGLHVVTRSVPEVVWALLLVFLVRPGIVAGALALMLHDVGVMGRLGADIVDDLDRGPLRSLRAAGASRLEMLAYGVLPAALPQLVTFLLYRWEVIIRASVVVGFISAAGLGYQLRLDLSARRWTEVALILLVYVLLVLVVDAASAALRRLAR